MWTYFPTLFGDWLKRYLGCTEPKFFRAPVFYLCKSLAVSRLDSMMISGPYLGKARLCPGRSWLRLLKKAERDLNFWYPCLPVCEIDSGSTVRKTPLDTFAQKKPPCETRAHSQVQYFMFWRIYFPLKKKYTWKCIKNVSRVFFLIGFRNYK